MSPARSKRAFPARLAVGPGVVASGSLELGFAILAHADPALIPWLLAAHAGVAAFLLLLALFACRRGIRSVRFYLFVLTVIAMGPVGVAGIAAMVALEAVRLGRADSFGRWHSEFFADPVREPVDDLDGRLARSGDRASGNGTVAPFADVLHAGSVPQKLSVLGLIADHFVPSHAPVLRTALNDPEPVIRVHAASVVARLDDVYQRRAIALRERLREQPQEAELQAELANCYREHSSAGLADGLAEAALRREALQIYEQLTLRFPGRSDFVTAQAGLLLEDGKSKAVVDLLRPLAWRGNPDPDLLKLYLSALLDERRLSELRLAARRFASVPGAVPSSDIRAAASLWAAAAREGAAS